MNKEENMEIRTLKTFVEGVKEEGASEPCKYVQFNRQEAQRLLDYVVELQYRIDKAIEYIETKISDKKGVVVLPDLLDILRGEDNEK